MKSRDEITDPISSSDVSTHVYSDLCSLRSRSDINHVPTTTDCARVELYHFETGVATTKFFDREVEFVITHFKISTATAPPPTGFTFEIISLARHIDHAFKCRTPL